jgi:hypothetical protein
MTENPEKKIIIDEDWKSQVEREREAAGKGPGAEPKQAAGESPGVALPPANLSYLASSLSIQASVCLGLMPDPVSGKAEKNLPVARHLIDTLEVLQQKTEGNRTPEESEDIEAMLYQLRMAYVQVSK